MRGDVAMIQQVILAAIEQGNDTPRAIERALPIGRSTLYRHLKSLEAQGKITRNDGKVYIYDGR